MGIYMEIHKVKNIDNYKFDIPTKKGLYALTGENAAGKSTVISCAATAFYVPSFSDYFGQPREGAFIKFQFQDRKREILESDGKWKSLSRKIDTLGITGFYEGSIVFGNRFKDIDYSLLSTLSSVQEKDLTNASDFVKRGLGNILHDDESYYQKLFVLKKDVARSFHLRRSFFYYQNKGMLISQLNMSTGENLLLTILYSIEKRLKKDIYGDIPAFMFLDEVELALHSSALRRLVFFLNDIAEKHNTVVLFSTHSIELIRSISPQNIFYLQRHADGSLETINPCYPVYATRNLESSNYGHDYIIMVEDELAKKIVDRILREKRLLSNKRILVIAVGGWTQVLRFAYDTIRSNLTLCTTKILIVLDRDIEKEVLPFLKKENIGFANKPHYLPIKSLEKYLLQNLVQKVDTALHRELNDYLFQGKSLDAIVQNYIKNERSAVYKDTESIKTGKAFYGELKHELQQIRKDENELVTVVVEYLFRRNGLELQELVRFFEETLT